MTNPRILSNETIHAFCRLYKIKLYKKDTPQKILEKIYAFEEENEKIRIYYEFEYAGICQHIHYKYACAGISVHMHAHVCAGICM